MWHVAEASVRFRFIFPSAFGTINLQDEELYKNQDQCRSLKQEAAAGSSPHSLDCEVGRERSEYVCAISRPQLKIKNVIQRT